MKATTARQTLAALFLVALFAPCAYPQQAANTSLAPRMSQDDFKKKLAANQVLVIDVRDRLTYNAGHIPGAISIPSNEIAQHAKELKAQKRVIVAYCG